MRLPNCGFCLDAYNHAMLRAFTSLLWIIAALALGFEAVAQPCDMSPERPMPTTHEMMSDMPCHDHKLPAQGTDETPPHHDTQSCCCTALLGNGVTTDAPTLSQPIPGMTLWAIPMPDAANSILLEHDPPPPRA
ncbi:MAG: hypothetical protein AAF437_00515 [Pseudomonadota bacterium]